jgi:rhombotail lipoprotein
MKRTFVILALVINISGCAGKGFNRGEMISAANAVNPTYASTTQSVEDVEKLKPQIKLPIKLAVAAPTRSYWRSGGQEWSPEELKEIESWKIPLQQAGVISDLYILPSNFFQRCNQNDPKCSQLSINRSTAAQVQADALLIINLVTSTDEYPNFLSILNLTIVGMWIAPGHHRDALTIAEGVMIDNRNEFLYAFARGEAEDGIIRPLMFADSWKVARTSQLHALHAFGRELIKNASQLKTR